MAGRESTQVGYRLRIQPPDLSTYPDRAKLVWFDLVVKYGLAAKLRDLRRGKDKDGNVHPLHFRTIKYRKSEVGPVTKTAPRGIPALDLSRVMSLLRGRAHTSSAEFWWGFDAVTGRSFAAILGYWRDDQGHDVFGLSPAGTAWTLTQALREWERWKREGGYAKAPVTVPGARPVAKREVPQPIEKREIRGRTDLAPFHTGPSFTGLRRLNARNEQWKPGRGF
jgi:hypothetical protein